MIRARFEGGEQLARVLQTMPRRASTGVMREALRSVVAAPIRDRAAGLVRRAPGAPDIADHVAIGTGRGDATSAAIVVGPSTAKRSDQPSRSFAVQGKHLELGTERMSMFAWLRPAFDQVAPSTLKPMAAAMWAAIITAGFGSTRSSGGGGGLR
jgi:hypothetical protein